MLHSGQNAPDFELCTVDGQRISLRERLEETCNPFRLLLDPERTVYEAYGLERSLARSWNLRTIWRYVQLLTSGRSWRGIQGDSAQLGGDFVVDADGIVQLAYRSHDPTDRPDVDDLLSIMQQRGKQRKGELAET